MSNSHLSEKKCLTPFGLLRKSATTTISLLGDHMITKFQVVKYEMAWHMEAPREELLGDPHLMLVDAEHAIYVALKVINDNKLNPTIWFEVRKQYHRE